MTSFESKQSDNVFVSAGRNACRTGINQQDNPYHGKYRKLWKSGYDREVRASYKITWVYFSNELEEDVEAAERYERKMRKAKRERR